MKNISIDISKAKKELKEDHITVGPATCGISAGALPVFEKLKKDLSGSGIPIFKTGCSGMCYNEPIVTAVIGGKKSIYKKVTSENIDSLISYIKEKKEYKELLCANNLSDLDFYKKQKRLIMVNCGIIDPSRLDHYIFKDGCKGLKKALSMKPKDVIRSILDSGLRGRGGAGFPTGKKWQFIAEKKGKKYLVCNGDEGDPGAFMNRTIMESDPFSIIEGITIGAYATGCDEGFIYTRAEYPLAIETIEKAINKAYEYNLLGKNILGTGCSFDLSVQKGAGAFVCGEETALIQSIEGKRGHPMPRPPYPAEKGIFNKPTNVNNVGTWANVSTIMKIGVDKYKKYGSAESKGTKIICLTGDIKRTGVIEVPFGTPLRKIIFDIGGGSPKGTKFKALLTGGPAGGCITKKDIDCPLDYSSLQELGTIMGSGGFIVTNDHACMVSIARFFLKFTADESCGKCTPCREGTFRLLELLTKVTRGIADEKDLDKIEYLCEFIKETSLCGLGQNAPNPIISTLKHFKDEYLMHIKEKRCPAGVCENLFKYVITDKCVGCGNCKKNCPVDAISGKLKEKHIISQKKCIKCGQCYENCAFEAIIKD